MTPDTLALARAIGTLPGAPTFDGNHLAYSRSMVVGGDLGYRTRNGIGWVQDPEDFARYVLDLEDAGTGGVLLARCLHMEQIVLTDPRGYALRSVGKSYDEWTPTLGIALARLIIARGGF